MRSETRKLLLQWVTNFACVIGGALLGAVLAQHFAVSNLAKSLKFQRDGEILNSTRLGITFLTEAQNELDENLALMLNNDYVVTLKFSSPHGTMDAAIKAFTDDKASKTNAIEAENMKAFLSSANIQVCHVDEMKIPVEELSNNVWKHGAPELADINYDLLRRLADYYMLVQRINSLIEAFNATQVQPGGEVSPQMAVKLRSMANAYNDVLGQIKQKNVVELKEQISEEVQKLSLRRSDVERDLK